MATYGVTPTGFALKRFQDLLVENRQKAIEIFQDLVPPGETVDTSDSSVLGRLIALMTDGLSDLWEAAQQDYSAFDPNTAQGIPLDNITQIGGVTRFGESASVASVIVSGDIGTTITQGAQVSSDITGTRFTLGSGVLISANSASAAWFTVFNVVNNGVYEIYYNNISSTNTVTYTATSVASSSEILLGLKAVVDSTHPTLLATIVGDTIKLERIDDFQVVSFSCSADLGLVKASNIGDVVAEETGPLEQAPNTITTINTPILGWDSITNPLAATPGRIIETDEELRTRFRLTKAERATNTKEAIYSAIRALDNVTQVVIYENDTDFVDGNGVQPHSFLPIIVGSDATSIGNAIWQNKPVGILSQGNTQAIITDSEGVPHIIGFERPNPVEVHIAVDITRTADFPANGAQLIKDALIEYISTEFGIGDDVSYSRLYTPINSVPDHDVFYLAIAGGSNPLADGNIFVPFNGIASVNPDNILITVY